MKRFFFPIFSAVLFSGFVALAQTPAPSPQELQEKVERLSGDVERLTQDNLSLKNKLSAIADEMAKMREEVAKAGANTGVQDDLRRLGEKLQEVDQKRIEDNRRIAEQIKGIGELMRETAKAESRKPRVTHVEETKDPVSNTPDKGYERVIEPGDTLSTIVQAYNKEFKSKGMKTITLTQVMEANPKVNWNALQVGKKIFIPMPSK